MLATSKETVVINVDNQAAIKMAKNDASGNRTKHIDIKYHIVRDLVADQSISLRYCPTEEMTADILTKPLGRVAFSRLCDKLGLQ